MSPSSGRAFVGSWINGKFLALDNVLLGVIFIATNRKPTQSGWKTENIVAHISEKSGSWVGFRLVGFRGQRYNEGGWSCIYYCLHCALPCALDSFSASSCAYPHPILRLKTQGKALRLMQIWLSLLSEGSRSLVGFVMETHGCPNGNQGLSGRVQWMLVSSRQQGFQRWVHTFFLRK